MFPPVDDAVLQNNPDFARLYKNLTGNVLNPDGSSKDDDPLAKERAAVRHELNKQRLTTAKHHLLTRAIAQASPSESKPAASSVAKFGGVRTILSAAQVSNSNNSNNDGAAAAAASEPLLDLLILLPVLLDDATDVDDDLTPDSLELLFAHPPLSELEHLLPDLTTLVSSTLRSSALNLTRLTHPSTNPSFLHRHIASLPSSLTKLVASLAAAEQALTASRLQTLASLTALLALHTQALTLLIRALEAKHGVIARSLELRASEVSLTAQRCELEAQQALYSLRREVYTPETIAALKRYAAHLRDARIRSEERIKGLKAELGEYGVGVDGGEGKEKVMKEMSRVYREMGRQMDDVKGDLDRLQQG